VQRTAHAIARAMQESPELEQSTEAWLDESPTPARDEVVAQLRQRAADLVAIAFAPGTQALSSQEEVYIEEEERRRTLLRMRAGLETLTDSERAFIRAYYEEEHTLEAIAARMGVVKRTVQRMHDRIKARLAQALRDDRDG